MKLSHVIAATVAAACLFGAMTAMADAVSSSLKTQRLSHQPIAFTKNVGQWDAQVLFRANAGGATVWFTSDGVHCQFTRRLPTAKTAVKAVLNGVSHASAWEERDSLESIMIKSSFVDANPGSHMIGLEEMGYRCNYFIGSDPNEWHTDVPNYEYVLYEDVYPGIDVKYYGRGSQLEYDLIVSSGADPGLVKIRYEGAKSLSVTETGELEIKTEWNTVTERVPYVYQETAAGRREAVGKYRLLDSSTFGFLLEEEFDPSRPLIIDPTLAYSTYLGVGSSDRGCGIAVDASGNAYVTGQTRSSDFPTENPYQTDKGDADVFVSKLSHSGDSLIYSTYLGGESSDRGYGIAVDASGNAYVTGTTFSSDFPIENPYQTHQGVGDAFVTKLSYSGNSLIYSTYLGGEWYDIANGVAVDASGDAYVAGTTFSSDFPTENPYQTDQGGADVFVSKLSHSGNSLIYGTYLGGAGDDWGWRVVVDAGGNAYVTGETFSSDFPTANPYQTDPDVFGNDAFVTKLSSSGNSLIYSTYLGGGGYDAGHGIAVDAVGNVYVTGCTASSDFPTERPYQTFQGNSDAFVTMLPIPGDTLIYSTCLGGGHSDRGYGIAVDGSGNAYVTGTTYSSDFPTENPYQTDRGDQDVFVSKLSHSGDNLIYSTYLGGDWYEIAEDIAVDGSSNAYVTGTTYSSDFPTENPYQTDQGGTDVFVAKLGSLLDAADDYDAEDSVPKGLSLYQNYPNPFNPTTVIQYSLSRSARVTVEIYSILGQRIRHYDLGRQMYGPHQVTWDGRDSDGKPVPSGVYFYRLIADDYRESKKMLLLR